MEMNFVRFFAAIVAVAGMVTVAAATPSRNFKNR